MTSFHVGVHVFFFPLSSLNTWKQGNSELWLPISESSWTLHLTTFIESLTNPANFHWRSDQPQMLPLQVWPIPLASTGSQTNPACSPLRSDHLYSLPLEVWPILLTPTGHLANQTHSDWICEQSSPPLEVWKSCSLPLKVWPIPNSLKESLTNSTLSNKKSDQSQSSHRKSDKSHQQPQKAWPIPPLPQKPDQSHPLPQKVWPILATLTECLINPTPLAESLTNPDNSHRKSD